jgi:hypothetical protein
MMSEVRGEQLHVKQKNILWLDVIYFIPQVADTKPPQPMDVANPGMLYDLIG